jgi:hypothetical protein
MSPRKQGDEVASFDDCLRILVNTPPQPKKAEKPEKTVKKPQK